MRVSSGGQSSYSIITDIRLTIVSQRPDYHNPEAERDFGMVLDCIKCTRALFSLYNLQTNGKTPEDKHESEDWPTIPMISKTDAMQSTVIVQVADARIGDMILSQAPIVEALVKGCRGIKIARSAEEVPAGCATEAINADVTVHVLVKVGAESGLKSHAADSVCRGGSMPATRLRSWRRRLVWQRRGQKRSRSSRASPTTSPLFRQMFAQGTLKG